MGENALQFSCHRLVCPLCEDKDDLRHFGQFDINVGRQLASYIFRRNFIVRVKPTVPFIGWRSWCTACENVPFLPLSVEEEGSELWYKSCHKYFSAFQGIVIIFPSGCFHCRCPRHTKSQTQPEECSSGLPVWAGQSPLTPAGGLP